MQLCLSDWLCGLFYLKKKQQPNNSSSKREFAIINSLLCMKRWIVTLTLCTYYNDFSSFASEMWFNQRALISAKYININKACHVLSSKVWGQKLNCQQITPSFSRRVHTISYFFQSMTRDRSLHSFKNCSTSTFPVQKWQSVYIIGGEGFIDAINLTDQWQTVVFWKKKISSFTLLLKTKSHCLRFSSI